MPQDDADDRHPGGYEPLARWRARDRAVASALAAKRTRATDASALARAVLCVALIAILVVFTPATIEVFELPKTLLVRLAAIALLSIALGRVVVSGVRDLGIRDLFLGEPIAASVLAVGVAAAISTAASTSVRVSILGAHESFFGLITIASLGVLFFATRAACASGADARRLLTSALVGGSVAAAYAIAQVLGHDPMTWGTTTAAGGIKLPFGTLGHPALLGETLAMLVPLAVALAERRVARRQWAAAILLWLVAAILSGVVVTTTSRPGWSGLASGLGVAAVGFAALGRGRALALLVLAIAGGAGSVLALDAGRSSDQALLHSIAAGAGAMADWRDVLPRWRVALDIFRAHPLTGCGLDAFQLAFEHHRTPAYWLLEWNGTPTEAQCSYLNVLACGGGLGASALAALILAISGGARRALHRAAPAEQPLVVAIAASLASVGASACFHGPSSSAASMLVILTAILSRAGGSPAAPIAEAAAPSTARWFVGGTIAITVASALAILGVARPFAADVDGRAGNSLIAKDSAAAIVRLERATWLAPEQQIYWTKLGTAEQYAARAVHSEDRAKHLGLARAAFERSSALVPLESYAHANRGRLLAEMAGETPPLATAEEAFQELDRALEIDPSNAYFYTDAVNAAVRLGDVARARRMAETASGKYPRYGPPLMMLGYLDLAAGEAEPACAALRRAVAGDWYGDERSHAMAWTYLANGLFRLREYDEAARAADEALRLDPKTDGAREVRDRARREAGR